MSLFKILISDLHLVDGHAIMHELGNRQQSSFEELLSAVASIGNYQSPAYRDAEDVELIINGDCFDFLAASPYKTDGVTDSRTVAEKLEKMIVAHGPFFAVLRRFMARPGRHVTFTLGNAAIVHRRMCGLNMVISTISGSY